VAVLSLALGIAPLAAIGGVVNALFFRPLAHVQQQDRLVALFRGVSGPVAWGDLVDAAAQTDGLLDAAGLSVHDNFKLTVDQTTTTLMGCEASANYFDVLGVPMALGRGFAAGETGADATPVAVISHTFWQRHFGEDPGALGRVLRIDGTDYTVVGVAPEGLLSPEAPVEPSVYLPLAPETTDNRGRRGLYGIGRLRDGATLAEVRAQLEVVQERLREEYPRYWSSAPGRDDYFSVHPVRALVVRPGQQAQIAVAVALFVTVGILVLATACSNLGNLLLARGVQRGEELAVRLALGADRGTLVAMLLTESVLLGCLGGGLGLLTAHWLTRMLEVGIVGPGFGIDVTVDVRVVAFTAVVSIATGVLFGLVPALRASRPDLSMALKGEPERVGRGRGVTLRNLLVVSQVAASLALLVSAGVLLRGLQVMQGVDPGFDPEGVLAVRLDLTQRSYGEVEAREFFEQLAARVAGAPDVAAVALAVDLPLDGTRWGSDILPEGVELAGEERILADENRVSAAYFELMRMPLVRGRTFSDGEIAQAAAVVIVNESLQARFWPDGAIGRRMKIGDGRTVQIIGVVRDAAYNHLAESPTPLHFWQPFTVGRVADMALVVRGRGDVRSLVPVVRRLVREADPELPVLEPQLMNDVVAWSSGDQRVVSTVLAVVGAVSLLLVLLGIYGVVSFLVSRRTHEVGLRVALGAQRRDVIGMVVAEGMRLVAVGVVVGLLLAFGMAQLLAAAFPGIGVLDPMAPLLATLLLAAAAALAALLPAMRASRVDPMVALRAE
jgi:predicted permease